MILPFLSLLLGTMGEYPDEFIKRWSGLVFGVTFVTAFLFSPIWGRIGDKYGRKKVLMCLGYGLCFCVLMMGFVQSVYVLFALRAFMGLFSGFISMSQALIAAQTPKEIAGRTLGSLQTGNVAGSLFGPIIGGILADSVGFKYTFIITAIITAIAATLVWRGIEEYRIEPKGKKGVPYTAKQVLSYIFHTPLLLMVMIVSTLTQMANFSIQPLLSLYVGELSSSASNVALLSGFAFSATGLGNLLFARRWGKLGDQWGYQKVMLVLLFLLALLFIPQAFVTSVWQLALLRFLVGMVMGGMVPSRTAYIRQIAPMHIQGEILGYLTSFRFLGNVLGPLMGGFVASLYGISAVFFATSALFLLSGCLVSFFLAREKKNPSEEVA